MSDTRITNTITERALAQIAKDPLQCECAFEARRPLAKQGWVDGLSRNSYLSVPNLELSHQHIIWESTRDNIGFGPGKGWRYPFGRLFSEKVDNYDYRYEKDCLNGGKMRDAVLDTPKLSFYSVFVSNCQGWAAKVKERYNELLNK